MDPTAIITNLKFLFYGYSAAFLVLLGFVLILVSRGRRIDQELKRLKSLVEDNEKEDTRR
jgi:CcmD family protein